MAARARSYIMIEGTLYKKGVVQPFLKCISQSEGKELLQEIHSEICGSHIGPRALSAKAIKQGFYWPMHIKDAEHIVKLVKHAKISPRINKDLRQKHNSSHQPGHYKYGGWIWSAHYHLHKGG
jgi:hypothetical protein